MEAIPLTGEPRLQWLSVQAIAEGRQGKINQQSTQRPFPGEFSGLQLTVYGCNFSDLRHQTFRARSNLNPDARPGIYKVQAFDRRNTAGVHPTITEPRGEFNSGRTYRQPSVISNYRTTLLLTSSVCSEPPLHDSENRTNQKGSL